MPWSTSTRRSTLPKDWHRLRAATWRAAQGQCQAVTNGTRCTWTGRLNGDNGQVDHTGDRLDHTRLQWLCPTHHTAKTQAEARAARPSRLRPREQHPGRLTST